jgi:hypothetical protein
VVEVVGFTVLEGFDKEVVDAAATFAGRSAVAALAFSASGEAALTVSESTLAVEAGGRVLDGFVTFGGVVPLEGTSIVVDAIVVCVASAAGLGALAAFGLSSDVVAPGSPVGFTAGSDGALGGVVAGVVGAIAAGSAGGDEVWDGLVVARGVLAGWRFTMKRSLPDVATPSSAVASQNTS